MSLLNGSRLLSPNGWRWVLALGLGFLAGVFTVIADSTAWPGWYPVIRGGVIDAIPAAVALKMTLAPGQVAGRIGGPPAPGR